MVALSFPAIALAQNSSVDSHAAAESGKPVANTLNKAGDIAIQPVRDVGINKREIPEVLQRSADDPYATETVRTCAQISSAMRELNDVLGPITSPARPRGRTGSGGSPRPAEKP